VHPMKLAGAETGAYKRYWGAQGKPTGDAAVP
jgi:hypothetical protein